MPNAPTALLSLRFGFTGPCVTVSTACASGATAIAEGVELLRRGAADLVLAGGSDSLLTYSALAGFVRLDVMSRQTACPELASRPFDEERDGFVMGEGAGFVVLQRAGRRRPTDSRARVRVRARVDRRCVQLVAPSLDGSGALACMRGALADAGITATDLSHVNAHGTSTVPGDLSEAMALTALRDPAARHRHQGHDRPPDRGLRCRRSDRHAAIARCAVGSARRGTAANRPLHRSRRRPRRAASDRAGFALSNSFGFGGMNTALVLRRAANDRPRFIRYVQANVSQRVRVDGTLKRTGARGSPQYRRSSPSISSCRPSRRTSERARGDIMPHATSKPRARTSR